MVRGRFDYRRMVRDAMLLTLKDEERGLSQGMQVASRNWKGQGNDSLLEPCAVLSHWVHVTVAIKKKNTGGYCNIPGKKRWKPHLREWQQKRRDLVWKIIKGIEIKGHSHQPGVCMGLGGEKEAEVEGNSQVYRLDRWVYDEKEGKKWACECERSSLP